MRKILCTIIAATLMVALTQAQEGEKEENIWAGPYAGISLGLLQGTSTATDRSGIFTFGDHSISDSSYPLGLLAGYNWITGTSGLLGVDADINWADFDASQPLVPGPGLLQETEWRMLSTLRVRGGLTIDNTLLFIAAGIAMADVEYFYGTPGGGPYYSESGLKFGYTMGAGIEFMMTDSISIRGEYLHVNIPVYEHRIAGTGLGGDFTSSANIMRIAAIYNF